MSEHAREAAWEACRRRGPVHYFERGATLPRCGAPERRARPVPVASDVPACRRCVIGLALDLQHSKPTTTAGGST